MADAETILGYIRRNVTLPGDTFITEYGKLTAKDKEDLKVWATAEMQLVGIPIK